MRGTTSPRLLGRWLLGLGTVAVSLGGQSEARADLHLAIGSKIEPYSYTSAYFPNGSGTTLRPSGNTGAPDPMQSTSGNIGKSESMQSSSISPYLALFFAQKYGIVLGLDIGYAKSSGEVQTTPTNLTATPDNNSYFQFGISLGTKIYFTQPRSQKVVPYVYLDVFKYVASIATDNMKITGDHASAQAAMHSPTGGTLAIGAEYFFSPGFSIGSEIFGVRVSGVNSEYKEADPMTPTTMTRYSNSYTQVAMYTGLTLNYRFQVSSSVRAAEEDSAAEAPKRRRAPTSEDFIATPPPVAPPPPSPESVD